MDMKRIASMTIPNQYAVYWEQNEHTGVHRVTYGGEERFFSLSEEAFKYYSVSCKHAATCAGWILDLS